MKLAFIFPGQGAQAIGMAQDLCAAYPGARKVFSDADRVLGFSLSRLCFEGPFDELTKTENCQPAVLTASIAALEALKASHPQLVLSYTAGLSLGEYSALVAARILSFEDAVYLVRKRGEFMEAASKKNPGRMSCVLGLELDSVSAICQKTGCEVANLNCPGQVVISGSLSALEAAAAQSMEKGAKRVLSLDVSGAFHSSFMNEARDRLKAEIDKMRFSKPACPIISNVDAKEQVDPQAIKENLIKQVNSATFWEASMRYLLSRGVETFFEIGPGSVLKGMFKKIDPSAKVINVGKVADLAEMRQS
jgi:[acyl-carrier-protein] S-malonyltransferase